MTLRVFRLSFGSRHHLNENTWDWDPPAPTDPKPQQPSQTQWLSQVEITCCLATTQNSWLFVYVFFFFLCTTKSFSTKLFCSATSDLQQMGKKMHFALFAAISLLCGVTFTTRTWTPQHLLMQNQSGKYFKTRVVIFTVVVSQELLLWIKSFTYLHP